MKELYLSKLEQDRDCKERRLRKRRQENRRIICAAIIAIIFTINLLFFYGEQLRIYAEKDGLSSVLVILGVGVLYRYVLYHITISITSYLFPIQKSNNYFT